MNTGWQDSGSRIEGGGVPLVARPLSPDRDLGQLLDLHARIFEQEMHERLWSWKYIPPWARQPYAWVAEAGSRMVGHLGVVPLRGQFNGEEVTFFLLGDILVDPEFRSVDVYAILDPGQVILELAQDNPSGVVYGFSAAKVGSWYRWLSARRSALAVEAAHDRIVRQHPSSRGGAASTNIELAPWRWDAPEIDEVWARQRGSVRVGLIRDRVYLSWRYGRHPIYDYSLFGVLHRGEPVGWIVTSTESPLIFESRIHDLLLPPPLRIPALRQAAAALEVDSLVAWLPENAVSSGMELRANGWQAMHLSLSPRVTKEYLAQNLYYSLGEADHWWL